MLATYVSVVLQTSYFPPIERGLTMKVDMKSRLITLEISWNPATTDNPEDWDWKTLLDVGSDTGVQLIGASPEEDFQEEFDDE